MPQLSSNCQTSQPQRTTRPGQGSSQLQLHRDNRGGSGSSSMIPVQWWFVPRHLSVPYLLYVPNLLSPFGHLHSNSEGTFQWNRGLGRKPGLPGQEWRLGLFVRLSLHAPLTITSHFSSLVRYGTRFSERPLPCQPASARANSA